MSSSNPSTIKTGIFRLDTIVLIPLLALYLAVVLGFDSYIRPNIPMDWDAMFGDQDRYLELADNLTHGCYATAHTSYLWSGPGYPLLLAALKILHLPLRTAIILNPFLLYGAMFYSLRILSGLIPRPLAIKVTYLMGIYPPFFISLPFFMTEPLTLVLLCGALYYTSQAWQGDRQKWWIGGILWGYLALTKITFGYVILALLLGYGLLSARSKPACKTAMIFAISLLVCLPYLIYTWNLTGKIFYWGNAGGQALYWMSNPYSDEYGDWRGDAMNRPEYHRHHAFISSVRSLNFVQQDAAYKRQAWKNITSHPSKFVFNWVCNQGRFWFNYPFSYKQQNPLALLYIFPNALLFGGLLAAILRLIKPGAAHPPMVLLCGLTFFFSWGLHSIAGCEARYLIPSAPPIIILMACAFGRGHNATGTGVTKVVEIPTP